MFRLPHEAKNIQQKERGISMSTSMNFAVFTAALVRKMQEKMGKDFRVFSSTVKKNNGVELTGIILEGKGCNTSPTIYIDDFFEDYEKGASLEEIAEAVWQIFRKNRFEESVDLSNFASYEKAKAQIAFRLVNFEKNRELLKEVPCKIFCNLAVVFYYSVNEAPFYGKASILIKQEHLEKWGVSLEELYRNAMKNTPRMYPARIENIESVMVQMLEKGLVDENDISVKMADRQEQKWMDEVLSQLQDDFKRDESRIPMYVLSNEQKLYGAACMLYPDILVKFSNLIQNDFYILPSSIHEVILLPFREQSERESLLEMVTEINRTQVEESEVLADSVYCFTRSDQKIWQLC